MFIDFRETSHLHVDIRAPLLLGTPEYVLSNSLQNSMSSLSVDVKVHPNRLRKELQSQQVFRCQNYTNICISRFEIFVMFELINQCQIIWRGKMVTCYFEQPPIDQSKCPCYHASTLDVNRCPLSMPKRILWQWGFRQCLPRSFDGPPLL